MDSARFALMVALCFCLAQNLTATPSVEVGVGPLLLTKAVVGTVVVKPVLVKKGLVAVKGALVVGKGQSLIQGPVGKGLVSTTKSVGKAVGKVPTLVGGKISTLGKAAMKIVGNIVAAKTKLAGGAVGVLGKNVGQVGKSLQSSSIVAQKVKLSEVALASGVNVGNQAVNLLKAKAKAGFSLGVASRGQVEQGLEGHDLYNRRSDLIAEHVRDIAATKGLLVGQYRAAISTSVTGAMSAGVSYLKKTFSQGTAEKVKSVGSATGILGAIQHSISSVNQANVVMEENDFAANKPVQPEVIPVPEVVQDSVPSQVPEDLTHSDAELIDLTTDPNL